ncbi:hypothetical protein PN416_16760 [Halorubrum ezzemoulense]|uniref:hypothetical protein n=1 Tax=Halorubrum ezzemoulense TaxID=337243 RepID=UPI00232EB0C8|nr:hypothetical protein [Halorubrum ezzemoulense]MDB9281519.1 hypothetical protein [Halorubrum ezzemoulense]MDB9285049.1 hypothetical protein [Halorubrum ezzemoulense]
MYWPERDTLLVFLIALSLRLVSVVVTTFTSLNTYADTDADKFARYGSQIADTILGGSLPAIDPLYIYDVWGAMLSPFWMLPGPSRVYARIGMAVVSAAAVYNVYVIVRSLYSRYAGFISVLPMIFYPSFLFTHTVVLREAMILFGLTAAARLLLAPSPKLGAYTKYSLVTLLLGVSSILRRENFVLYVLILVIGVILEEKPWERYKRLTQIASGAIMVTAPLAVLTLGNRVLDQLVFIRQVRSHGRTAYLTSVLPNTIPEAVVFSWIGALYFLYTPFPWMVASIADLIIMVEGLSNIIYTIAAVTGARILSRKTLSGTAALVAGVTVGTIVYGLGTVNVGTAVRHRPMVLWVIFLFGGVGIAEHIRMRVNFEQLPVDIR